MRKTAALLLALILLLTLPACRKAGSTATPDTPEKPADTEPAPVDTPEGGDTAPAKPAEPDGSGLIIDPPPPEVPDEPERTGAAAKMAEVTAGDIRYVSAVFDNVTAEELAARLNEAADKVTDEEMTGECYYYLELYLSGGPEGYSSDDEYIELACGLDKGLVRVDHHPQDAKTLETVTVKDADLYGLVRDNYRTERNVDAAALELYGKTLRDRAQSIVERGPGFTGYEIARFALYDTFEDGGDCYEVYEWAPLFTAADPSAVMWVGGMYLDADAMVAGRDEYSYFVVKTAGSDTGICRFLGWWLYQGPDADTSRRTALESIKEAFEPKVKVCWASDRAAGDRDEFRVPGDYVSEAVFYTEGPSVYDLRLYSMFMTGYDEAAGPAYDMTELYAQEELRPGRDLLAGLSFPGDMPTNAVSYREESGQTVYFALWESGMDGSLGLSEFVR